jgi:hypothetical protein
LKAEGLRLRASSVWLGCFVLAALVCAAPAESQPATDGHLEIGYQMRFWGIPFGQTNYSGSFTKNSYAAKAHFQTNGLVSVLWRIAIDASASGRLDNNGIAPTLYDTTSKNHSNKLQRVKVDFTSPVPTTIAEPTYDTTQYPVSDDQKKGALDPMSAFTLLLANLQSGGEGKPCSEGVHVFDGRRRYDVSFTYIKDEPVKLDNGLFAGATHLCQIHYNYVAGYAQEIIKDDNNLPPMFANFADISDVGAPSGHYTVAVKLYANYSLGTFVVALNDLKLDGVRAK